MDDQSRDQFECVVSADLFRRAMYAQSNEETRYYLNGIHIEPCAEGGVLMVGTDGHRMLVFRDVNGFVRGGNAIIKLTKPMVKALTAKPWQHPGWGSMPKTDKPRLRYLAVKGDRAAVVDFGTGEGRPTDDAFAAILDQVDKPSILVGGYQWAGVRIYGDFPNWRKVITEPGSGGVIRYVNVNVLAPVVEALSDRPGQAGFRLAPTKGNPDGPVFVVPYGKSPGFGVVMGLRPLGEEDILPQPPQVPSWLAPAAQPQAA